MKALKLMLPLLLIALNSHAAEYCKPLYVVAVMHRSGDSVDMEDNIVTSISSVIEFGDFEQELGGTQQITDFLATLAVRNGLVSNESEVNLGHLKQLVSKPIRFGLLKGMKMSETRYGSLALSLKTKRNCGIILNLDFMDGRTATNKRLLNQIKENFFSSSEPVARPSVNLKIEFRTYNKRSLGAGALADDVLITDERFGIFYRNASVEISNAR